jgi:hypothetical protein
VIWDDSIEARVQAALRRPHCVLAREGATEGQVAAAERELGITLPPSYRTFLLRHNGGVMNGCEFLCLMDSPYNQSHPDLVWTNRRNWERYAWARGRLEVIAHDEWVDFIELSQARADGECPIVVREHSGEEEVVAQDFPGFLEKLARFEA